MLLGCRSDHNKAAYDEEDLYAEASSNNASIQMGQATLMCGFSGMHPNDARGAQKSQKL